MTAGSVVSIVVLNLLLSAVLMLVLNFMMGGNARFGAIWFASCLSWAPRAVESILFTFIARASSTLDVSFGQAPSSPLSRRDAASPA